MQPQTITIEDMTEIRRASHALEVSEIRYRRLFEAAKDGILILDPDTRQITDANPFIAELLGYSREEMIGKELFEIGLLKDEEASRAPFENCERTISSVTKICRSNQKRAGAMKSKW
jgi:PAS domain S-box-containing protein